MSYPSSLLRSQPVNAHTSSQYGLLPPPPTALLVASNFSSSTSIHDSQHLADLLRLEGFPEQSNWTPNKYSCRNHYAPVELLDYPQVHQPSQNYNNHPQLQLEHHTNHSDQVWSINRPLLVPEPLQHHPETPEVVHRSAETLEDTTEFATSKPFISKLSYILRNPDLYGDCIQWNEAGTVFIFAASTRFSEEVLREIYSHNTVSAFTRQLNTYAFRHLTNSQLANTFSHSPDTTTPIRDLSAWQHDRFTRDRPNDANRMVPVISKARDALRKAKQRILMERGISLAARVRRPAASN